MAERRKLKIGVITGYFPTSNQPYAGHSAYQTLRVMATIADVHVFCPQAQYPGFLTPRSARRAPLDPAWRPGGVEVTYIPYPVLPVVSRTWNGFTMQRFLKPHVRAWKPDILLNYVIYPDGLAAVGVGRALDLPVILTSIGSDINNPADRVCAWLTRYALRSANFVTTVSHDLCAKALAMGSPRGRTKAKLNGCDTTIFHPSDRAEARNTLGLDPDAEIVTYVGRIDLAKGLLELVEAIASLRTQRPRLRCYLVGYGSDQGAVEQAIARLDLGDIVHFGSPCRSDGVALWMAASNLFALPSYREGCPNVIIEALACGCPVVASNVGGIPELMDDTCGRMVPPRTVPELAAALVQVLDQTWDAEAISRRHSRSWRDVASELEEILDLTHSSYYPN